MIYFIEKLNTDLNIIEPKQQNNEINVNEDDNNSEEIKLFKVLSKTYHFSPGKEKEFFELRINCYNRKILLQFL